MTAFLTKLHSTSQVLPELCDDLVCAFYEHPVLALDVQEKALLVHAQVCVFVDASAGECESGNVSGVLALQKGFGEWCTNTRAQLTQVHTQIRDDIV